MDAMVADMDIPGALPCVCIYAASGPLFLKTCSADLRSSFMRLACSCDLFQLYGPSVLMYKQSMYRDEMDAFPSAVPVLFNLPGDDSKAAPTVACKDLGR